MFGLNTLARVAGEIRRDVSAAHQRDPAARGVSSTEILTSWPGVHALLTHRVAHVLHGAGAPVVPRAMAYGSRAITGIEIHPAARIGQGLFIDHGSGVVIGETAEIGDDVTLYQGVTLGGTSWNKGKRHPTLEDGIIRFDADSDAVIVKGLVALVLSVYNNRTPQEIVASSDDLRAELGLDQHLSQNRSNGLASMLKQLRLYALAYSMRNATS